jgi:hypothetical protein
MPGDARPPPEGQGLGDVKAGPKSMEVELKIAGVMLVAVILPL